MNIQQSINQGLYQASLFKGIYSQTPEAKIKRTKQAAEKAGEQVTVAAIEGLGEAAGGMDKPITKEAVFNSPATDQVEQFGGAEVQARKEVFQAEPTSENYKAYANAKRSLEQFQEAKARYKSDKELRQKLLQGVPEVPVKRTKVEVENNGN